MAKKPSSKKRTGDSRKPAAKKSTARPAPAKKPAARAAAPAISIRKIKSPLSKTQLEEFRQMLLDKRRSIVGDMTGIEAEALRTNRQEGSGDLSNMPTHPADIGTDNFEQEFTLGLLESERTLLAEINSALERIDGGTYGVCLGTGKPIGAARLKARPWARYCIDYAKLIERGLAQPSQGPASATSEQEEEEPEEADHEEAGADQEEPAAEEDFTEDEIEE